MLKELKVVAGILVWNNKILCVQKGKVKYDYLSFKYEFPGGKIEAGESPAEALARELQEELLLQVEVREEQYFQRVEYQYPDFHLDMRAYLCELQDPTLSLKEHIHSLWCEPEQLRELDWAPADWPIVEGLERRGI